MVVVLLFAPLKTTSMKTVKWLSFCFSLTETRNNLGNPQKKTHPSQLLFLGLMELRSGRVFPRCDFRTRRGHQASAGNLGAEKAFRPETGGGGSGTWMASWSCGCGSNLNRRGKAQVLVHVSTYQDSILVPVF